GRTSLALAVKNGYERIVKLPLENDKVRPDLAGEDSRTSLLLGTARSRRDVVELLLPNGNVNPNLADTNG
ncbi:hypothetical protein AOQ84DRAFT_281920, partial [Glonium stellatum]